MYNVPLCTALMEGATVFYYVFFLSSLQCTLYCNWILEIVKSLREFEGREISSKVVEVIVHSKEEKAQDFCLDVVQEFGLWLNAVGVQKN